MASFPKTPVIICLPLCVASAFRNLRPEALVFNSLVSPVLSFLPPMVARAPSSPPICSDTSSAAVSPNAAGKL